MGRAAFGREKEKKVNIFHMEKRAYLSGTGSEMQGNVFSAPIIFTVNIVTGTNVSRGLQNNGEHALVYVAVIGRVHSPLKDIQIHGNI